MKTIFAALLAIGLATASASATTTAPAPADNSVAEWCNDYKYRGH